LPSTEAYSTDQIPAVNLFFQLFYRTGKIAQTPCNSLNFQADS